MVGWKRLVLVAAGFGGGFAFVLASTVGIWIWYQGRPTKPKPWNTHAIIATFDNPEIGSGEPEGPNGQFRPEIIILHYTLENTTDVDYHMPPQEQLELDGRLKREKSLTATRDVATLDKGQVFIPANQRRLFNLNLIYAGSESPTESFGPDPKTKEEHRRRVKLIADYVRKEYSNLDGFVLFDNTNRYQINLPNGWDNFDLK
jgi:hypothetical protein